jgi:hypothetical protein
MNRLFLINFSLDWYFVYMNRDFVYGSLYVTLDLLLIKFVRYHHSIIFVNKIADLFGLTHSMILDNIMTALSY